MSWLSSEQRHLVFSSKTNPTVRPGESNWFTATRFWGGGLVLKMRRVNRVSPKVKRSPPAPLCGVITCVCAKSLQSCPILCDPMDCRLLGSSAHEILQARILEWVAMPSSKGSSQPRDRTHVSYISCICGWVLYHQGHLGNLFTSQKSEVTSNPESWLLKLYQHITVVESHE